MAKTLTIRLSDQDYELFRAYAAADNRAISNLIETAALKHLQEEALMSSAEEREILSDSSLVKSLKAGHRDARKRRGRFAI